MMNSVLSFSFINNLNFKLVFLVFMAQLYAGSSLAINCRWIGELVFGKTTYERNYTEAKGTNFASELKRLSLEEREQLFKKLPQYPFTAKNGVAFEARREGTVFLKYKGRKARLDNALLGDMMAHQLVEFVAGKRLVPKYSSLEQMEAKFSTGLPTIILANLFSYKALGGKFGGIKYLSSPINNERTGLQMFFRAFKEEGGITLESFKMKSNNLEAYFRDSQTEKYLTGFLKMIGLVPTEVNFYDVNLKSIRISAEELINDYGIPAKDIPEAYLKSSRLLVLKIPVFRVEYSLTKDQ